MIMIQEEKKNFIEKWFNKNKFNEASEILDTIDTSVKKSGTFQRNIRGRPFWRY